MSTGPTTTDSTIPSDKAQLIAWLQRKGKHPQLLTGPPDEEKAKWPGIDSAIEAQLTETTLCRWYFDKDGQLLRKHPLTDLERDYNTFKRMNLNPEVTTEIPADEKEKYSGVVSMLTYHFPSGMRIRHYYDISGHDITIENMMLPAHETEVDGKLI